MYETKEICFERCAVARKTFRVLLAKKIYNLSENRGGPVQEETVLKNKIFIDFKDLFFRCLVTVF